MVASTIPIFILILAYIYLIIYYRKFGEFLRKNKFTITKAIYSLFLITLLNMYTDIVSICL
jgi:hypothetical protein